MKLSRPVAALAAFVLMATGAGAAAAAPKGDPERDGPADGPRGKRVQAAQHPDNLPEYWDESPRLDHPDKGAVIPNHYIVVFEPGTASPEEKAREITAQNGGKLTYTYEHALQGFAAVISADRIDRVRAHPNVAYVEEDRVAAPADTQTPVTWGLDRTDQRDLPLSGSYTDGTEGVGVHAYIIDTGVLMSHQEFSGRAGNGYDAVTAGGTAQDCNGHGTHVAGTVGGSTYGMADKVVIHPVRVLDCYGSGTNSGVIAGVDWVRNNHIKPAVANMSLGGGASSALDTAVANAITSGVTFVLAAGNDNANACNYSPARVSAAVTVGATTNTDARSSFSNYGTCLDIFAPGSNITSAWHTSISSTNTISGTSMAAPHVAGAAALYLSANPSATPATVRDALVNNATTGKVSAAGTGSPNVLLFTMAGTAPAPAPAPTTSALINGGFESGSNGWTQYSSGGYNVIDPMKPRSGLYGAWAGGYNYATERISQSVLVPANGILRYYWHLTSSESTSFAYDYMHVRVRRATGELLATLRTRSNTAARNAWYLDSLSLAAFAGQTVVVSFEFSTDSSVVSSFFVDDVSVS